MTVLAITYKPAIDDPQRIKKSKAAGLLFGTSPLIVIAAQAPSNADYSSVHALPPPCRPLISVPSCSQPYKTRAQGVLQCPLNDS
jgi:hypothetical protein